MQKEVLVPKRHAQSDVGKASIEVSYRRESVGGEGSMLHIWSFVGDWWWKEILGRVL